MIYKYSVKNSNEYMNKRLSWVRIWMAQILAYCSVFAVLSQPSTAAKTMNIVCKTDNSTPTVVATPNQKETAKDVTILSFLPQYFSPQDAVQNCQNTAKTLQALYDTDNANYLTNDKLNSQPVICVVERRGIGCNHYSAQILFALDQKINPSQALYNMLGQDFKQSQPPNSRTVSRIYSDIKPTRWWQF